ncbi:hypothetical protein [Burkholderia sp. Bp9015]|uniref:hypothetical protein n=1 Tax=Burkholderia sp. Bp9015 TaxID=2184563 RepID=UPI000F5974BF|nr:hypothetical protein [Burkholderia sp. Bp9015]RQR78707.1 hypothetical protein DIE12_03365 [Burkholderia sp. Bp9015]
MNDEVDLNKPATIGNVIDLSSTLALATGAVIARVVPLLVQHPVTDADSLDGLLAALEDLAVEIEQVSPAFGPSVIDAVIASIEASYSHLY